MRVPSDGDEEWEEELNIVRFREEGKLLDAVQALEKLSKLRLFSEQTMVDVRQILMDRVVDLWSDNAKS